MQTLADLKQIVKPGLRFDCRNYMKPELCGERIVTDVTPDGFWYTWPENPMPMFFLYHEAHQLSFEGETMTVWRKTTKAVEPVFMFDFTQPDDE